MILMRILPGVLKELMKHVPTVLFQTVEWGELASELPKLSRRMIRKEGYTSLFGAQNFFLKSLPLELTSDEVKPNDKAVKGNTDFASQILHLFFAQLFSPHGLFLDLRSQNFAYDEKKVKWHPTGLWTKFADDFQSGLIEVYDGFYLHDQERFKNGLSKIGLLSLEWPAEDQNRLCELFKAQFASGQMEFDLDKFRESMMEMANFLLKKRVKISRDFLYLGINLVTLYSTLEETGVALPVNEVYLEVRNQLS